MTAAPAPSAHRRLRTRLAGAALVLAGCVALCGLGAWQWSRYLEKQALWDGFARGTDVLIDLPRAAHPPARYAHVRLTGRYLTERQFLLDSMTHAGESGYRVLTPLERPTGDTVLVDRGWVPRRSTGRTPDLAATTDEVAVTGRADLLPSRGINLADRPAPDWPRLVNYPRMEVLEQALGRPLYPQIVLLDPEVPGGYVRDRQPPGLPPAQHLGYAITWFGCALTLAVLYLRAQRRAPAAGERR